MQRLCMLTIAIILAGCGESQDKWQKARPATAPVSGLIKLKGEPIADAKITLAPTSGSHGAFAVTDANGQFKLTTFDTNDGAVPGDYLISIAKVVVEFEPDPRDPEHLPPIKYEQHVIIPAKYGDFSKSGLAVNIPQEGKSDLNFDLN